MILQTLKNAEAVWRDIVRLATPLDSDKKVNIGTKPKEGDFEAYTNDKEIFINVDENKFRSNFEKIVVPSYHPFISRLYRIKSSPQKAESLENLVLDTFLFLHFHEQLHPWLCPNSKDDRKKITKALYDGIKEAEPGLSKSQAMMKVNNCKNLIWDTVLNTSFLYKTSDERDQLSDKITFVFDKRKRKIDSEPVSYFPSGILPVLYIISANNHTTDIPISLIGGFYSSISFNNPDLREKAMGYFVDDLKSKRVPEAKAQDILKRMYAGFVSELSDKDLAERGIDKKEYLKNVLLVNDLRNKDYEANQEFFIKNLTNIFDAPSLRYGSLKGFIKALSSYISLTEKQGSPDSSSSGGGGGGGGEGEGEGEGEEEGKGEGEGKGKSQEEMDEDSIGQTLDDLLGELDGKEADDLLEDAANSNSGRGMGAGPPGAGIRKRISILAADEYYKKNAETLEVRNSSEEMQSFDLGDKQVWKLIHSNTLTQTQVATLNHQSIINFQKKTGLPVLVELGNGFFKLNEYQLKKIPQKSYTFAKTGIEIPDNWVLFQDSSGSMTGGNYVGTKDPFDFLNLVKYGLHKGLYKVCKELRKDVNFGIVDFSDRTVYKGLDSLVRLYECKSHPIKEVSLSPQCGGTVFNSDVFKRIEKDLKPGKSIYTFITDGVIGGDTNSLYREIERFAKNPGNCFVFVEINCSSGFGQSLKDLGKKNGRVLAYHVSKINDIKDKLGSILVKYD